MGRLRDAHLAQTPIETAGQFGAQRGRGHCAEPVDLFAGKREHSRGHPAIEWQNGLGLAMVEPFGGDVAVIGLVMDATAQHRAPGAVDLGRNTQLLAHEGKPGIRADQQGCGKAPPIGKDHMRAAVVGTKGGDAGPGEKVDAFLPGGDLEQGAADQVVGNQRAEAVVDAPARVEGQRKGRRAVENARLAQRGDLVLRDMLPRTQRLERVDGTVGKGDLASVEGGLGKRLARLALDNGDLERASPLAGSGEAACKGQTCRTAADHHHIIIHHAAAFLVDPGP